MRFKGGPYDGRDLPIEPPVPRILRLPDESDLDAFLGIAESDPGATGAFEWPHLYELDETVEPRVFRFKRG